MIQMLPIDRIKENDDNPRFITDERLALLVNSLQQFPDMLKVRPLVLDRDMTVLGGNMRLRAAKLAGLTSVPVIFAEEDWTDEQKKEFVIKDNIGYGQWDWNILTEKWADLPLTEWGLEGFDMEQDFSMSDFYGEDETEKKHSIHLKYTENEYREILAAFEKREGSKEEIVYKLLLG